MRPDAEKEAAAPSRTAAQDPHTQITIDVHDTADDRREADRIFEKDRGNR